ncbi:putative nitric oxide synthase isoform X1 [Iris pallida]|uniref:Nitric oxide synthase isoform X1 n=1 Tax=Iris pallida TaxID=29817 RepID=A0AAX6H294_IRIPA|nr:putative nitric oxide synthase isoform X1 [Iris pallida]
MNPAKLEGPFYTSINNTILVSTPLLPLSSLDTGTTLHLLYQQAMEAEQKSQLA